MITLTLTANTIPEMRELLMAALGMERFPAPVPKPQPEPEPKRPVGRPRKVDPERTAENLAKAEEMLEAAKPVPYPDPVDEGIVVSVPGLDPEPNGADHDPIALEKLKQETVSKLPDMFAAGKVGLMRAVLTKYGKGAKSFPEIEAKDFPEIAAALARGDGS